MNESEQSSSEHIAVEELASLSEPGSAADPAIVAHLARCPRCVAIYAEFARTRAHFLHDPEAEMPPADLIQRGMDIPVPAVPSRAVISGRSRQWWLPAAAVLATVALIWLWPTSSHQPPAVPPDLQTRLSERMRSDSYGGLLYEDSLLPLPSQMRGLGGDSSEADLSVLLRSHRSAETPDAEVDYWLIAGLLATNRQRDADSYIRQSLDRFPDDARFLNLAAILAYKRSDLQLAEKELRAALEHDRSATLLLNLALVLTEAGRSAEAAALLSEFIEGHPSSPAILLARERASTLH